MRPSSASLRYVPVEIAVWLTKAQLSDSERIGDLLKAVLHAWQRGVSGDLPGSLPDDDTTLARIIGSGSRARLVSVRQEFTLSATAGLLVCGWLSALFLEAQERYQSAAERGRRGGRPRKSSAKAGLSDAKSSAKALIDRSTPSEEEGLTTLPPPTERAAGAAAGPGDAAAAAAPREDHAAFTWLRAHPEQQLELDRATDARVAQRMPGESPDSPRFSALRARTFEFLVCQAYGASAECRAERSRAAPNPEPGRRGGEPSPLGTLLTQGLVEAARR